MPCNLVDRYQHLTGCLQLQDKMGEEENMKTMLFTFSNHLLSNFFHFFKFQVTFFALGSQPVPKRHSQLLGIIHQSTLKMSSVRWYHQPVHLYDAASQLIPPTSALSNTANQLVPPTSPLLNAACQLVLSTSPPTRLPLRDNTKK